MRTQGLPPPNPRPEGEDRCAGKRDLLGAKPALTLAVPLVSPPTSPTSWAGHAPCGRFGIDDFPAKFAASGRKAEALVAA
jgi:hypothetical protein